MDAIERETIERAERLRKMTDEFLNAMTPPERDRLMQRHLAQARGPVGNAILLRQMIDAILWARRGQTASGASDDG